MTGSRLEKEIIDVFLNRFSSQSENISFFFFKINHKVRNNISVKSFGLKT